MTNKKKVAILTNMMEFLPGYSLTGIIKDQIRMLKQYGYEIDLFVNEKYHGEPFPDVNLKPLIPFIHLIDYTSKKDLTQEHKLASLRCAEMLKKELIGTPIVFTHDFIFTGWFLPYGLACSVAGKELPDVRWLHWIHSIPGGLKDWWSIREYGPKHKIVYPNESDKLLAAEQYRGNLDDVRVIPHIKDLRSFFEFDKETCDFLLAYPKLMQSEIVQIYPASVDRLEAKRVREVMILFAKMKKAGFSVFLAIANQWTTTTKQTQDVDLYKRIATRNGLKEGIDFIFTSSYKEGVWQVGVPQRNLRELMMLSNLFIFPTREETFGLVLPEVSLASGCLCVLNKSLQQQLEVSGFTTLYFNFGSFHMEHKVADEDNYFEQLSQIIVGRMSQNESIMSRTFMRRMYNWDNLYNKYYAPIFAESATW